MSKTKTSGSSTPSFKSKRGFRVMGLKMTADGSVKGFFGGNAYLAILALLFICVLLLKSGLGFVPGYRVELNEARRSGIELTNMVRYEVKAYQVLLAKVNQALISEKRHRFGDLESAVYLYEEFEALIDDDFAEAVEEYVDLEEGEQKEAAGEKLRRDIAQACAEIPEEELLLSITRRIPSIEAISPQALEQATALAQQYAIDDFETPDEVNAIGKEISKEMGALSKAYATMQSVGAPLQELEKKLATQTGETDRVIKLNRQTSESIAALEIGLERAKARGDEGQIIHAIEDRLEKSKNGFLEIDEEAEIAPVYELVKNHDETANRVIEGIATAVQSIPDDLESPTARESVTLAKKLVDEFEVVVNKQKENIKAWRHDKEITTGDALAAFFFGSEWQTGSPWQNVYGFLPLLSGSLLVAGVALVIAVPLAVSAALYVNQFARSREAGFIKPAIEFIQAIPSVVLGLFGVLVLAALLKDWSHSPLISWIPGFPITERLNVLLASVLLAFMAAPTIFTLAEDALNNVPRAYSEASLAMGATKLQTALKIVFPAAISGIVAAVMLGFGRVVGETMVVLMVAGNKASIPEFSAGLGVVGQPVHTMTSIIAQEYGEVTEGSLHWQALFMVGLVLFTISLIINSLCQRVLNRKTI